MKKQLKTLSLVLVIFFVFTACQNTERSYNDGVAAMSAKNWDEAIACFEKTDFKDSKSLLEECQKEKGMSEKADNSFLDSLSTSLMHRYELSLKDTELKVCIDYEFNILSTYKGKEFYDSKLQEFALNYINGLELEKESITAEDESQELIKYEGYAKRLSALKNLTDEFGLLKDNQDYIANYYNQADKAVNDYNALKAIEEDLESQLDDNVYIDYVDEYTQRLTLKNNTEYAYDLYIDFTYYNKSGVAIDTKSYCYDNIQPGQKRYLEFYCPEEADSIEWITYEELR